MTGFPYDENVLSSCVAGNEDDCSKIFYQHQSHYQRESISGSGLKNIPLERYQKFKENAEFIHNLNLQNHSHRVALNQFSDLLDDELPLYEISEDSIKTPMQYKDPHLNLIPIKSQEDIVELLDIRSRNLHKHYKNRKQKNIHQHFHLDEDDPFAEMGATKEGTYSIDFRQETPLVEFNKDPYDFSTFLNWATSSNPDGVPLVHPAEDQVSTFSLEYCQMILLFY